jgi:hypothetical protein
MRTQTAERQELYRIIDTLPDEAIPHLAPYIAFLKHEYESRDIEEAELTGIAATRAAIAELRAGKGEKVTIEQIMAELNAGN